MPGFNFEASSSAEAELVRPSSHPDTRIGGPVPKTRLQPASWNVFVLTCA